MTAHLPEPTPDSELRASHAEREAVVERLQAAAVEGRIDFAELDTRVEQALNAKSRAELALLTADLPVPVAAVPDPGKPVVIKAGAAGAARRGPWQVPAHIIAHGDMGGLVLDFTRTTTRLPEIQIELHGKMGGIKIVVPEGWGVEIGDFNSGLGGLKDRTSHDRLPDAPVLRLSGNGGMGGVVIRNPGALERRKLRRELER